MPTPDVRAANLEDVEPIETERYLVPLPPLVGRTGRTVPVTGDTTG
jgi:hypothetical protein